MKRKILTLLLLVSLCAIICMVVYRKHSAPINSRVPARAEFAPDFSLKALDGTRLRLSDYRGKVVLLDFWATWCEPCGEEIPRLVEWQNRYRDRGFQVIGVSMDDSRDPVQEFSRKFRINYPVAPGTQQITSQYSGILGLPVNIVIGRDGRIRARHLGLYDLNLLEQELISQF